MSCGFGRERPEFRFWLKAFVAGLLERNEMQARQSLFPERVPSILLSSHFFSSTCVLRPATTTPPLAQFPQQQSARSMHTSLVFASVARTFFHSGRDVSPGIRTDSYLRLLRSRRCSCTCYANTAVCIQGIFCIVRLA